ncbi:MAG: acyl carrier protein [Clostridiales bacterium]|nr:acyl carrier protein [Clostridiales bacterium]
MQYEAIVRQALADMAAAEGRTSPPLGPDDDLSQAGVNSLTFVDLIVRLEDALGVCVPDDQLLFSEAGTIRKLCGVLAARKRADSI